MAKADHFNAILDAHDIGLDVVAVASNYEFTSVRNERPMVFKGLPPEQVRTIVHIDECAYRVTIECVASGD